MTYYVTFLLHKYDKKVRMYREKYTKGLLPLLTKYNKNNFEESVMDRKRYI